jgi:hypothetical protein
MEKATSQEELGVNLLVRVKTGQVMPEERLS